MRASNGEDSAQRPRILQRPRKKEEEAIGERDSSSHRRGAPPQNSNTPRFDSRPRRRGLKEFATEPANSPADGKGGEPAFTPARILVGNAEKRKERETLAGTHNAPAPAIRVLTRPTPRLVARAIAKCSQEDEPFLPFAKEIKFMTVSARLIDDNLVFMEYCKEYLLDWNKKYGVVGIAGRQGVGKSTLLSMLAGNEPSDAYMHYVFRPGSREAVELGRHQTTKINIFINKWRTIFLDCQSSSPSLFEDYVHQHQRDSHFSNDGYDLECMQLSMLVLAACHTLILCIDSFEQVHECLEELLHAEQLSPISSTGTQRVRPRKIHIVVVHQHAEAHDFHPVVMEERMSLLETAFSESSRFELCDGLNMASLLGWPSLQRRQKANYILLGDIRVAIPGGQQQQQQRNWRSGGHTYGEVISALRVGIAKLQEAEALKLSELEWFNETRNDWKRIRNVNASVLHQQERHIESGGTRQTGGTEKRERRGGRRGGENARNSRQREPMQQRRIDTQKGQTPRERGAAGKATGVFGKKPHWAVRTATRADRVVTREKQELHGHEESPDQQHNMREPPKGGHSTSSHSSASSTSSWRGRRRRGCGEDDDWQDDDDDEDEQEEAGRDKGEKESTAGGMFDGQKEEEEN